MHPAAFQKNQMYYLNFKTSINSDGMLVRKTKGPVTNFPANYEDIEMQPGWDGWRCLTLKTGTDPDPSPL